MTEIEKDPHYAIVTTYKGKTRVYRHFIGARIEEVLPIIGPVPPDKRRAYSSFDRNSMPGSFSFIEPNFMQDDVEFIDLDDLDSDPYSRNGTMRSVFPPYNYEEDFSQTQISAAPSRKLRHKGAKGKHDSSLTALHHIYLQRIDVPRVALKKQEFKNKPPSGRVSRSGLRPYTSQA